MNKNISNSFRFSLCNLSFLFEKIKEFFGIECKHRSIRHYIGMHKGKVYYKCLQCGKMIVVELDPLENYRDNYNA